MAFDFKKEYKEFYLPKNKPEIVQVPKANYIAVRGKGDPNEEGGAYKSAIGILYAVAYTLKMSYKTDYKMSGFYEYVVPPLEGFWWQEGIDGVDYTNKETFHWISVIRLPEFVTKEDFDWAVETATKKKKMDCSVAEFLTIEEGLCVQMMHLGAFDEEPRSVALIEEYLEENGYVNDFTNGRLHHEIYLSDARKVAPEKWKTVIRHPIKKKEERTVIDTRCGLHCEGCEYKETCGCGGCIETNGHPFHGECPVAICCQNKGFVHCGECPDIPCELLTQYSCDPEHGDTPAGARIEQCKRWTAANQK